MPGRTDTTDEHVADVQMEDEAPPSHQPSQQPVDDDEDVEENTLETEGYDSTKQRVKILPGSTDTAASFEFIDEGHTLGNALRFIVMKNPDVEFCAYSIPHPSENIMNLRIQTYDGTAVSALSKGLKDLQELCDVVSDEFTRGRDEFAVDRMES